MPGNVRSHAQNPRLRYPASANSVCRLGFMPPKGSRITAGKRRVREVSKLLPEGIVWDPDDLVVLDMIEAAEDRRVALAALLDVELAKGEPSSRKVTELAAEARQTEAMVVKMIAGLRVSVEALSAPPKSARHVAAGQAGVQVRRRNKGA